jgi:hypothetical protein
MDVLYSCLFGFPLLSADHAKRSLAHFSHTCHDLSGAALVLRLHSRCANTCGSSPFEIPALIRLTELRLNSVILTSDRVPNRNSVGARSAEIPRNLTRACGRRS